LTWKIVKVWLLKPEEKPFDGWTIFAQISFLKKNEMVHLIVGYHLWFKKLDRNNFIELQMHETIETTIQSSAYQIIIFLAFCSVMRMKTTSSRFSSFASPSPSRSWAPTRWSRFTARRFEVGSIRGESSRSKIRRTATSSSWERCWSHTCRICR